MALNRIGRTEAILFTYAMSHMRKHQLMFMDYGKCPRMCTPTTTASTTLLRLVSLQTPKIQSETLTNGHRLWKVS